MKVKVWRNKKLVSKKVLLGRLESTKEFKAENKIEPSTSEDESIESLKILVRNITKDDISARNLPKNTTGVVVTKIFEDSPLMFLSVNDVIVEVQKKIIRNSNEFSRIVDEVIDSGQKTLLFAIYNSSNQRSYLTVKLN